MNEIGANSLENGWEQEDHKIQLDFDKIHVIKFENSKSSTFQLFRTSKNFEIGSKTLENELETDDSGISWGGKGRPLTP